MVNSNQLLAINYEPLPTPVRAGSPEIFASSKAAW